MWIRGKGELILGKELDDEWREVTGGVEGYWLGKGCNEIGISHWAFPTQSNCNKYHFVIKIGY